MLRSRSEGDDDQFYSIALQRESAEAREGHRTPADAMRAAVYDATEQAVKGRPRHDSPSRPRGDLELLIDLKCDPSPGALP
jgi:hypothetical protein